jgi:nucleotide-binding universal stress UspA family protein
MTFKTLLVELAVGESNRNVLQVAADLARRFHAQVIGIAGAQPMQLAYGDGYYSGEAVQDDRDELRRELSAAEAEFRAAFSDTAFAGSAVSPGWHSATTYETVADFVSRHAREADLIVTAGGVRTHPPATRCSDTGALLMQAGRPVLLLPRGFTHFSLERALIAWKDTRETRRAIADALPLLRHAKQVVLAQFVSSHDIEEARIEIESVSRWLSAHDINAQCITSPSVGEDPTSLNALIEEKRADLVVAGAYGHSRLREWVLGGVTRDLLLHESHCSLLSH